jgi:hypothetical protein
MMPGYLDHVLARAFGPGPVLRPRPRSRFEPVFAGPADPLAWPEDPATQAAAREPAMAEGPALSDPDPGPMPRAVPGSAPDPKPGHGRARAPEVPPVVAGPEPSQDGHAPDPFGIKEPATERPSSDQPPANLTAPRTRAAASRTTARPPSAAHAVSQTTRGPGTRPPADPLKPEGLVAGRRPQPAAPPDRFPGRAPAEPAGPAAVIAAAHRQPSLPAASRQARRAGASPGEPSPVPSRAPVPEAPVPVAPRDTAGPLDVAGPPVSSGSPGAAEPSARPVPPDVGRRPTPVTPSATARPPWLAGPPVVTAPPATPGPLAAALPDKDRRYSPTGEVAPAPPVVNVTIGRVEVRPPPAPPPPPPAPAPGPRPLSLGEYLERRNRGPS